MTVPDTILISDQLICASTAREQLLPHSPVRLAATRCTRCQRIEFPGRELCPTCAAPTAPCPLGPDATLVGFTSVLHPVPGGLVEPPYDIGVARFAEGLHVIGLLTVGDGEYQIGMPIETITIDIGDGRLTYAFR